MIEIKKYYQKMVDISEKEWELFSSKLIRREFAKNSIILKVGQKENYLSFIEKGIVRKCIPREFDDFTFDFAFANSFVTAYEYFLTQEPSTYQLETLTDTILWSISYEDLKLIYNETDIGNTIGRLENENLFKKKSKRELSFLTQSAEERYLDLFTEQPKLLQFIPLKYIASYIGVTPQALSRIRRRIS